MKKRGRVNVTTILDNERADIKSDQEVVTGQEERFLYILKNDRSSLLGRLQDLGLLRAFLEAENGTKPEP